MEPSAGQQSNQIEGNLEMQQIMHTLEVKLKSYVDQQLAAMEAKLLGNLRAGMMPLEAVKTQKRGKPKTLKGACFVCSGSTAVHRHRDFDVYLDDRCRKQVETFKQGAIITERREAWIEALPKLSGNHLAQQMLTYIQESNPPGFNGLQLPKKRRLTALQKVPVTPPLLGHAEMALSHVSPGSSSPHDVHSDEVFATVLTQLNAAAHIARPPISHPSITQPASTTLLGATPAPSSSSLQVMPISDGRQRLPGVAPIVTQNLASKASPPFSINQLDSNNQSGATLGIIKQSGATPVTKHEDSTHYGDAGDEPWSSNEDGYTGAEAVEGAEGGGQGEGYDYDMSEDWLEDLLGDFD